MHTTPLMKQAVSTVNTIRALVSSQLDATDEFDRFPRDIESLVVHTLEIPVIRLSDLTLQAASDYLCALQDSRFEVEVQIDDRPLYGLLHVGPPTNAIFVRAGLPDHIANYVLAHELGHFVADVLSVQQLWLRAMPEQEEAIRRAFDWHALDGYLELQAVIKGLPDRPSAIAGRGRMLADKTTEREILADLIARELLTPWAVAAALFSSNTREIVILQLRQNFGLPRRIAAQYYADLQTCNTTRPDMLQRLFAPLLRTEGKHK